MNQTLEVTALGGLERRQPRQPRAGDEGLATASAATSSRATSTASARSLSVEEDGFARRAPRRARRRSCSATSVDKGSIALDGVSLTVAELGEAWVEVSLIPETLERTNLGEAGAGKQI